MRALGSDSYLLEGGARYETLGQCIMEGSNTTDASEASEEMKSNVGHMQKKPRLTKSQVKSLEMSFEMDSKLEPERKIHLAQDVGLQPRQVAVWFQNRRARCKAKQLEKDYTTLKELYHTALAEKEQLQEQIFKMKTLLNMKVEGETNLCGQLNDNEHKPTVETVLVKSCTDDAVSGHSSKTDQSEVTDSGNPEEAKEIWRTQLLEKVPVELISTSAPYIFVKGEQGYIYPDEFFTELEEHDAMLYLNWGN